MYSKQTVHETGALASSPLSGSCDVQRTDRGEARAARPGWKCRTRVQPHASPSNHPRRSRRGSISNNGDGTRAMRMDRGTARCLEDDLSLLWNSIVQPILDALNLNVRFLASPLQSRTSNPSILDIARARSTATLVVRNGRTQFLAYSCCWEIS
jgi:hypothetical protein